MEHHEDSFFDTFEVAQCEPAMVFHVCPQCDRSFDTYELLRDHQFEGHPFRIPTLLFLGIPIGRLGTKIVHQTNAEDWQVIDADSATLNGRAIEVDDVGTQLSGAGDGVHQLELVAENARFRALIDIAKPATAELQECDDAFGAMMSGHELSLLSIQRFLDDTRGLSTISDYRDGIAIYLQGVLLREGSDDSWVERTEYRHLYERSQSLLAPYFRPLAASISSLVSFHFNDFSAARRWNSSQRLSWAAERFERLLRNDRSFPDWGQEAQASFDAAITDNDLESILAWTCSAGSTAAPHLMTKMEEAYGKVEKLDRTKVGILIAEACLGAGDPSMGAPYAQELVHDHMAGRWASNYLDLVGAS